MIAGLPPIPEGTSSFARWARWVSEQILALRPMQVPGSAVSRTSKGTHVRAIPTVAQAIAQGSPLQSFIITGLSGKDYFVAQTWDGHAPGGTNFNIAKHYELWPDRASEVIDGVTVNYSRIDATDDNNRTANDGTNVERQVMVPRYVMGGAPGSLIFAVEVKAPYITGVSISGVPVTWLEVLPHRQWARRYIQT